MDFEWQEYLFLAQALRGLKGEGFTEEAAQRSSVSRLYYAAFGCAKRYAINNGLVFRDQRSSEVHKEVRDFFERDRHRRHITGKLNRLRQWRNQCDYEDRLENPEIIYDSSCKAANEVLEALGMKTFD